MSKKAKKEDKDIITRLEILNSTCKVDKKTKDYTDKVVEILLKAAQDICYIKPNDVDFDKFIEGLEMLTQVKHKFLISAYIGRKKNKPDNVYRDC